jgi:hypothetical protein
LIGVAPKGFVGTEVAYAAELFVPLTMAHEIEPGSDWLESRDSDNLFVVGRLKPGISRAQAASDLEAITLQLGREHPKENEGRGVRLLTPGLFLPGIRDSVISFAAVLMGVVGLVLLLACVNLANLLLARATERRRELAIRLAVEAPSLSSEATGDQRDTLLFGGLGGVMLAVWINGLVADQTAYGHCAGIRSEDRLARAGFRFGSVVVYRGAVQPAAGLQSSRPDLVPALKDDTALAGFRRSRLRNTLVVVRWRCRWCCSFALVWWCAVSGGPAHSAGLQS